MGKGGSKSNVKSLDLVVSRPVVILVNSGENVPLVAKEVDHLPVNRESDKENELGHFVRLTQTDYT